MPTAYGKYAKQYLDPAVPPNARSAVAGGAYGGNVFSIIDEFTVVTGQPGAAIGDNIVMGDVNKGVVALGCTLSWSALGAGATLLFGTDDDTDKFVGPAAAAAAAGGSMMTNFADGFHYTFDKQKKLWVTVGGAVLPNGGIIRTELRCQHL